MIEQMIDELKRKLVIEFEKEVTNILDLVSDATIEDFNMKTIEKTLCKKVFDEIAEKYKAQEPRWIPVEFRKITQEERKYNHIPNEFLCIIDCPLPEDGEEILIVRKMMDRYVTEYDTCYIEDGYYLESGTDWTDVAAWMPLPEYEEGCAE